MFVNGNRYPLLRCCPFRIESNHTCLFDMRLEEHIKLYNLDFHGKLVSELDEALLKNEWIHVELKLSESLWNQRKDEIRIMGIHVLKEKSSMEEDVIFTDPYIKKRKLDEYLRT